MIVFFSLLPALVGLSAADQATFPRVRTIVVQDEFVIRVPVRPRPFPPRFAWQERKGPKCIAVKSIRGAFMTGPRQIDFVVGNDRRVRANLDKNCPSLDFYEGFYLNSGDARICADRDVLRSRMGGSCEIENFRDLRPVRRTAVP